MADLRIGSLCTGTGALDAAVMEVFGGELVFVADNDPGAAALLAHHHPEVPNLGDITAVDWSAAPPIDLLAGGFTEWLMGEPEGHVTAVPGLTRNQMLRLLGNSVVRKQGSEALRVLKARFEEEA